MYCSRLRFLSVHHKCVSYSSLLMNVDGLKKIHELQRLGQGSKQALSSCADKYTTILTGDIPQATEALQKGNPKFAESGANDAANEATRCDNEFSGKSLLTKENNDVHDVAAVTAAIAGLHTQIVVKVITAKANDGLKKIHQLDLTKLSSCASKYRAILIGDIPEATEALLKGDPKFAENGANDAPNEATDCENEFSGKSLLTKENNAMHDVAAVTAAIVRLLFQLTQTSDFLSNILNRFCNLVLCENAIYFNRM
ncbi:hypothetical protein VNO77_05591 [Canavalia gladiata]|uniref:Pectinesterase inhibitor domain-containing protein n=1 Tax=Canavalia gladiata TaxID=3824 RepID=A0AAN9N3U1_CANGL